MQSEVLGYLVEHRSNGHCTPSTIAKDLKLARSTVHDQLGYLVSKGFVKKNDRGQYKVTLKGWDFFLQGGGTPVTGTTKVIHVDGIAVKHGERMTVNNVKQVFDMGRMVIVRHSQIELYLDTYH